MLHHSHIIRRMCERDRPHIHAEHRFLSRYATSKLTVQNISDCQYVAAMNPTAGSFQVNTWDLSSLWVGYMHHELLRFPMLSQLQTNAENLKNSISPDQSSSPTALLGLCHWNAKPDLPAGHLRNILGRASSARKTRETFSSWSRTSLR